jgi:hypothetical protein
VTLRARWVTLRARWVTLRARWVTLRASWVTLRARWVPLRDRWVTLRAQVVVVDLDTGVCQFFQADVAALPHTALKSLRRQLAAAVALTHTPADPADVPYLAQQEGAIRDAMLRFFVHVLGAYSRHVRPTVREGAAGETLSAAGLMLDHDSFVAARVTSQRSRAFLGAMRQTQMYEVGCPSL